ncbi:putative aminoacrylate hydrolase RutD [Anaerotignum neopropionicum]|uniref:Putative aminoacrylate hydrolase RutD n=1 Tax=Anaerotignum neopropionicum TaxID=36847 RepID=A0A136WB13_9FIRM|nr:alpha/beta hydrolase [Anaerotignum neopropionicum]KXL51712.1 putative aminoacrylate hydrolase RutD [Anaerotignum neopropionicum]
MILVGLFFPTWTPRIAGENSISELGKIEINGTKLAVMIRGYQKDNPIVIVVHGGPCCSEIPYIRKYQESLEKEFTIVHYDQRGSGKSYNFFEDYSSLSPSLLVEDLIELSSLISKRFDNQKIILMGHSFGTYISMQAIAKEPQIYEAYIGIGQVADKIISETDNLYYCIEQAKLQNNQSDVSYLESLQASIVAGEIITPRDYVRKYGGAARQINETKDMMEGILFNPEYNLLDAFRYSLGVIRFQDGLMKNQSEIPITHLVQNVDIPIYFVMGKYDHMTSTSAAKEYFDVIDALQKEFIIYKNSAHYPQLEEKETFYQWMCDIFVK